MQGGNDHEKPAFEKRVLFEITSIALSGVLIIAVLYTFYFARPVLLPVAVAILLTFLLRPVIRVLKAARVPEMASAGLILLLLVGAAVYGIAALAGPASVWINQAPETSQKIKQKIQGFVVPVRKVTKTAEDLQKITGADTKKGTQVEVKSGPNLTDTLFSGVKDFFAQGTVMIILLFFLLASGDLFIRKISDLFQRTGQKRAVFSIFMDIEKSMSRYLVTVTIINIAEGIAVAVVMYFLGMPNPVLWGVMAAFLIYIPYLGPLVGIVIVAIVAFLTFESAGRALLAPLIYFIIDVLQGHIITPIVLGKRFSLNPVIIFVWLIFWGWIWGVAGALVAMPLLTLFKILCDHIEPLERVGKFLEK